MNRLDESDVINKLIVFDKLIKNFDRYFETDDGVPSNLDNLLLVPDGKRVRLIMIDHTLGFVESTFEDEMRLGWADDRRVFGVFQNLRSRCNRQGVEDAIRIVSSVSESEIVQIIDSVPPEWSLTAREKAVLAQQIFSRARTLGDWLPDALFPQKRFIFEGPRDGQ